jgi:hypothetical protein
MLLKNGWKYDTPYNLIGDLPGFKNLEGLSTFTIIFR